MLCVILIFAPFVILPTIYYSVRGNILDAFNIRLISKGGGNFSVSFLSFLIQYVLIFGFFGFAFYKLIYEMLNNQNILNIGISLFIVISLFTLYSYCSDLYSDVIPELDISKKVKKSKR